MDVKTVQEYGVYRVLCTTVGIATMSPSPLRDRSSFSPLFCTLLKPHQFLSLRASMGFCLCCVWAQSWGRLDVSGMRTRVETRSSFWLV